MKRIQAITTISTKAAATEIPGKHKQKQLGMVAEDKVEGGKRIPQNNSTTKKVGKHQHQQRQQENFNNNRNMEYEQDATWREGWW